MTMNEKENLKGFLVLINKDIKKRKISNESLTCFLNQLVNATLT